MAEQHAPALVRVNLAADTVGHTVAAAVQGPIDDPVQGGEDDDGLVELVRVGTFAQDPQTGRLRFITYTHLFRRLRSRWKPRSRRSHSLTHRTIAL